MQLRGPARYRGVAILPFKDLGREDRQYYHARQSGVYNLALLSEVDHVNDPGIYPKDGLQ